MLTDEHLCSAKREVYLTMRRRLCTTPKTSCPLAACSLIKSKTHPLRLEEVLVDRSIRLRHRWRTKLRPHRVHPAESFILSSLRNLFNKLKCVSRSLARNARVQAGCLRVEHDELHLLIASLCQYRL